MCWGPRGRSPALPRAPVVRLSPGRIQSRGLEERSYRAKCEARRPKLLRRGEAKNVWYSHGASIFIQVKHCKLKKINDIYYISFFVRTSFSFRYHAVIQYRSESSSSGDHEPVGFYLYDLDSTHGTWHNKKQCYPKQYYRLRVGHMIKFGGSTRMILLAGTSLKNHVQLLWASKSFHIVVSVANLGLQKWFSKRKLAREIKLKQAYDLLFQWSN